MTSSTTDQAGHPGVTEISDLAEDLLPPSRTAHIRRHLETCASCADVYASLEEIRGLLGTLPGPLSMPDDVTARVDAALASEASTPATAAEPGRPRSPEPETQPTVASPGASARHDHDRVSRETPTVADRPAGRARISLSGPGRKGHRRTGRRGIAVLGAVAAAAALGIGSVIVSSVTGGASAGDTVQAQSAPNTFSEGQLKDQVTSLLIGTQGTRNEPGTPDSFGVQPETGTEQHVFTQPTIPECVREGIGRSDTVLATREGVYQGKETLLVVLPDASDSARVTAYLVESTCVHRPSADKAEILLTHSYARP